MTKAEQINWISEKTGESKKVSKKVYEAVIELFKSPTENPKDFDNTIQVIGFGTFKNVYQKEAKGKKVPAKNEPVNVSAKSKLVFVPSKGLKTEVKLSKAEKKKLGV
jgi:nucleoid DNA-binding protein